jgi:hypothetical protein
MLQLVTGDPLNRGITETIVLAGPVEHSNFLSTCIPQSSLPSKKNLSGRYPAEPVKSRFRPKYFPARYGDLLPPLRLTRCGRKLGPSKGGMLAGDERNSG